MRHYNLVFNLSSYKSMGNVRSFIESLPLLQCNHLAIIVMPIREEAQDIGEFCQSIKASVVILGTNTNGFNMGHAFPFAWCQNNDVRGDYQICTDDDVRFVELSRAIYPMACISFPRYDACMMGFESTHPYKYPDVITNDENFKVGLPWIDGNFIMTQWQDNEVYGGWDGPRDYPLTVFTETEYCHRFRALTGRKIIMRCNDEYYDHQRASRFTVCKERAKYDKGKVIEGNRFWMTKFGIKVDLNDAKGHDGLYEKECLNMENFRKHIVFDGLWTDWAAIYQRYHERFEIIYDGR